MPTDIVIPNVGESVTSGVVSAWTKGEGDWVERDDIVMELETDKITVEVPAPASGTLKHGASEGDEVEVGAVVGSIDESGQKPEGDKEGAGAEEEESSQASAKKEKNKPKATTADGEAESGGAQTATAAPPKESNREAPTEVNGADVKATPLARKVAQEHGIELSDVSGSGAGQRIREEDVRAYVRSRDAAPARSPELAERQTTERGVRRERMSPLRQRIASRLVGAQQTAAMLTTFNECDMTAVMELRKKYKEQFEKRHGIGLGFMGFFVKAVCSALEAYPVVNASIVEEADGQPSVEYHDYCDVAVAVSTPKGLVVPVLRGCQNLSMAEIESGIKDLAERARDGKLTLEEMQGGTFTITNGGVFGSLMSTPILNPPQSGILGMHAIKKRPMEDPDSPGQLALRPMMYLALSYDHRIVDGAGAVRFLVHVKEQIEEPSRLLLEV